MGEQTVDKWQSNFLDKLNKAQGSCAKKFEDTIEKNVAPAFDDISIFVRDNGFRVSTPLKESGRRSFKFELAENAYFLLIFRFTGVGEFEARSETFVPGNEPILRKFMGRVTDIDEAWSRKQFQSGLDGFVELLAGEKKLEAAAQPDEQLAAV